MSALQGTAEKPPMLQEERTATCCQGQVLICRTNILMSCTVRCLPSLVLQKAIKENMRLNFCSMQSVRENCRQKTTHSWNILAMMSLGLGTESLAALRPVKLNPNSYLRRYSAEAVGRQDAPEQAALPVYSLLDLTPEVGCGTAAMDFPERGIRQIIFYLPIRILTQCLLLFYNCLLLTPVWFVVCNRSSASFLQSCHLTSSSSHICTDDIFFC